MNISVAKLLTLRASCDGIGASIKSIKKYEWRNRNDSSITRKLMSDRSNMSVKARAINLAIAFVNGVKYTDVERYTRNTLFTINVMPYEVASVLTINDTNYRKVAKEVLEWMRDSIGG